MLLYIIIPITFPHLSRIYRLKAIGVCIDIYAWLANEKRDGADCKRMKQFRCMCVTHRGELTVRWTLFWISKLIIRFVTLERWRGGRQGVANLLKVGIRLGGQSSFSSLAPNLLKHANCCPAREWDTTTCFLTTRDNGVNALYIILQMNCHQILQRLSERLV